MESLDFLEEENDQLRTANDQLMKEVVKLRHLGSQALSTLTVFHRTILENSVIEIENAA